MGPSPGRHDLSHALPADGIYDFGICVCIGRRTVIAPRGELDIATVERFEAACDAIDFSSVAHAVLDLRDLVFIDVSGMRAVLRLHARCLEESVELLIRPGPRTVQKLFQLTGADRLLPLDARA